MGRITTVRLRPARSTTFMERSVPNKTGCVELSVTGELVAIVQVDSNTVLWAQTGVGAKGKERIQNLILAYREVIDMAPQRASA